MPNCPVCGTADTSCGEPYTGSPIDMTLITSQALRQGQPVLAHAEAGPMLRVEIKPGDIRRVNPRDLGAFMAANPGAKNLDAAPPAEPEAEMKMQAPAANKARSAPKDSK